MSLLIVDLGSNAFGKMHLAKELIRAAHNSGADLIKGQAYRAEDIKTGSMSENFYKMCEFTEEQYIEQIDFARSLGNDMFFSVFSPGFERLKDYQGWSKYAGSQSSGFKLVDDTATTIVSFKEGMIHNKEVPRMVKGWALYVNEYMVQKPDLKHILRLKEQVKCSVGYSDHSLGIESAILAVKTYGVDCIEKHFTLQKDIAWWGTVYRDTVHAANPRELETIANDMSGVTH